MTIPQDKNGASKPQADPAPRTTKSLFVNSRNARGKEKRASEEFSAVIEARKPSVKYKTAYESQSTSSEFVQELYTTFVASLLRTFFASAETRRICTNTCASL